MKIVEILEKNARQLPDKPAVIFRGIPVTYLELKDKVYRLVVCLQNAGVKKGDKVAIFLPGCPEYIYSYLAVWSCGACAVPLDFMLTEDELVSCLEHSESKVLIAKQKATVSLEVIQQRCPGIKKMIDSDFSLLAEFISNSRGNFSAQAVTDQDYAIIFYTSGTTGKPKGVLINYRQLGAPPQSMGHFVDLNQNDVVLCALPFSHLGGLIYIQNTISFGLTMILMERFIPTEFLKNISNYKVSCFWIVPSMYYALLQLKEFETFDLSSLRWMVTFGASNSPDALRRFHQFCPQAHLLNGWGLTETNAPTTVVPMGSENIESVGKPAPWIEVKISDDQDIALPNGQVGEVAVKSWVVTDGYYKDPILTAETIRDGWFYTGDLGRMDAQGFLYIVGRKKEMIKVAGEIVFEPEVESVIHKHPDVAEAAVIGVPDKLRGEVPKAFVVIKENSSLPEEDLRYFLRQHLASFKIPHYFEFCQALPKNRVGKVDKEQLRRKTV